LKCENPADGLSLNALLTSSSAGIAKKEKTMKCALALALGLIVCLPCMTATAASTSCDSVSTPNQQVNQETVRRINIAGSLRSTVKIGSFWSACSNLITEHPASLARFEPDKM
jgi:hypothetical protein